MTGDVVGVTGGVVGVTGGCGGRDGGVVTGGTDQGTCDVLRPAVPRRHLVRCACARAVRARGVCARARGLGGWEGTRGEGACICLRGY